MKISKPLFRWEIYSKFGKVIKGTQFLACKTPLKPVSIYFMLYSFFITSLVFCRFVIT